MRGDTTEIVIRACRLVGRPIFFSVVIMLISFLPVFAFGGQEGKLSHPLAFTKSFAMIGVAILAITLVPAMIPIFIKGRLSGEEENSIVRSFIHIYKPVLTWMIDRPAVVWWMMAVDPLVGAGFVDSAVGVGDRAGRRRDLRRARHAAATGRCMPSRRKPVSDRRIHRRHAFSQSRQRVHAELNEGSIMDMPLTAPRVAMGQAWMT